MHVGHTRRTHDSFPLVVLLGLPVTFSSVPIDTQKLALRRLVSFHIYPQLLLIIRGHLTHLGVSLAPRFLAHSIMTEADDTRCEVNQVIDGRRSLKLKNS
jgi:hypothetical protein